MGHPPQFSTELKEVVTSFIIDKHRIRDFSASDIDGVHRVGAVRPGKPRGMIVRLFKREVRMNILKSRKAIKGTGFVVAEDWTVQNGELLNRASKHDRIQQAWFWNNIIWAVGKNGNRIRVTLGCNIDELLNASNL